MTRRRTANPDWDDAATISHCARMFRNNVAVGRQEVVPSDNSPKQLKKINTSWERFERIFRRAWIIETTLPPQLWLNDNPQKQDESLVEYITRVQEARTCGSPLQDFAHLLRDFDHFLQVVCRLQSDFGGLPPDLGQLPAERNCRMNGMSAR
jgi:hypothetical protein